MKAIDLCSIYKIESPFHFNIQLAYPLWVEVGLHETWYTAMNIMEEIRAVVADNPEDLVNDTVEWMI